jgi:altronate dehydratase large subunit
VTKMVCRQWADGRPRVRNHVAVISAVGCANIVCQQLQSRHPEIAALTHQHGCGQLGSDVDLTRELLAALACHANVATTVFVSLGCESNTPDQLLAAAQRRGGSVKLVGIQASGGVEAALAKAERLIAAAGDEPATGASVEPAELRIGLIADDAAVKRHPELLELLRNRLGHEGFSLLLASKLQPTRRTLDGGHPGGLLSISNRWRTRPRESSAALAMLRRPPVEPEVTIPLAGGMTEQMTVLSAMGAHVIVLLIGRANLTGAALSPTIKVSTDHRLDALEDVVDVPWNGADLPGRVLAAIRETVAGSSTRAEAARMRDLALPRLGPNY